MIGPAELEDIRLDLEAAEQERWALAEAAERPYPKPEAGANPERQAVA
ncbi:hypothetical protein [Methylobacterium iners]|uniref:Uncharacterized protein n=1 Tax=Methylobacterium iners TaxID=418707 RepID=A0ABQ4RTW0_9HYPH|nr:hypothetical protein [Methylobacterium iners]GJD93422.1 hypothetical protein OCOJLMKI_0616 [Methylobacterium iners]